MTRIFITSCPVVLRIRKTAIIDNKAHATNPRINFHFLLIIIIIKSKSIEYTGGRSHNASLGVDDSVHHGIETEARDALDAQFGGDVLAVGEDGVDADVQSVGNLLVDHA